MSGELAQNLTPKRFNIIWVLFILFYLFSCTVAGMYFLNLENRIKNEAPRIKAKQIEKIIRENALARKTADPKTMESIYSHSGGINPGFKKMVSNVTGPQEMPKQRAYEEQLAKYEAEMAERERIRLEEKRRDEEIQAQERALMEEERLERLKEEQAMKQLEASQAAQTTGGLSPAKTFTAPKTQKPRPKTQQKTQQKTVIGTLKTSKMGESSFQSY